jgi:hypothetical protein
VLEEQRAARAAAIAERHEKQIARIDREGPSTRSAHLRARHERIAALHRRLQQRHLAAAQVHLDFADRLARFRNRVDPTAARPQILSAVASTLGASGVGITVLDSGKREAVRAASNPTAAAAMDLEYTLGEGPGRDAAARHDVVVAGSDELRARWPRWGPAVAELGVHSVASAPLRSGSRNLGAVTAFDAPPQHRLDELAGVLLVPEYNLGLPLLVDADVQAVVHQAAGMTAVQQGCDVDDALALIRAHAYASNRSAEDVAAQIVNRQLRLD